MAAKENQGNPLVEYDSDSDSSTSISAEHRGFIHNEERENWQNQQGSENVGQNNEINLVENITIQDAGERLRLLENRTEEVAKRNKVMADQLLESSIILKEVMNSARQMVQALTQLSQNNLEAEKTRLKIIEEKNRNLVQAEAQAPKRKTTEDNGTAAKRAKTSVDNSSNQEEGSRDLSEQELLSYKMSIKREYKLKKNANFEIWIDSLRSELLTNDLLDVIEPSSSDHTWSEANKSKRSNWVRDIIINRIDENYHKKILNIRDPVEIIRILRSSRKCESNVTHTSVRSRLYSIKMERHETVDDFCERFDSIVREYEACEDVIELTAQEMRSAFYQAVSPVTPELRNADLIRRQTSNQEMTLDEIKTFISRLEAEKRSEIKEEIPTIQRVQKLKCFRCNEEGHWYCFGCGEIKSHKKEDCPNNSNTNKTRPVKFRGSSGGRLIKSSFNTKTRTTRQGHIGQRRMRGNGRLVKDVHVKARRVGSIESREPKNKTGKLSRTITFIADSGATHHIVNDSLILRNFERCQNTSIKSANKKEIADIVIDGKGELILDSDFRGEKTMKLQNVFAAKDVSENLLSLRKLADSGFKIYLDNKVLRVYNKVNNEIVLEGQYEKPNWILNFKVRKQTSDETETENQYEVYCCRATISEEDEMSLQSQTHSNNQLLGSEGEPESAIGREKENNLISSPKKKVLQVSTDETDEMKSEQQEKNWDCSHISRNVIKIDDLESLQNLEELCIVSPLDNNSYNSGKINEAMLWHCRLGHASLNYLKKMQKLNDKLKKVIFDESILECEVCIMSKMEKLPFKETRMRAERQLQLIHTDTMGPIKPPSHPGQKRYINVYIDDYSRLAKAYSLKTKDESAEALEKFLISTRNFLGKNEKVCYIRSDQGTEFTGKKFLEVLSRENIENEFAAPYTPEHNGVAERFNSTIQKKVRAYMFDSGLPKSMWELAVDASIHAYNRTPHKSIGYETPLTKFVPNAKCHFDQIKRFGCIAYVKIPKPSLKFGERALKAVLVGYTATGYLMWHPSSGKFFESRHVRCNEKLVYKDTRRHKSKIRDPGKYNRLGLDEKH
ncbi:uncharacterized protein LOC123680695 isoform X2 [Harmonia axyridis]|nr:uncharacterized protein LOC123680695 isoform X2 [Harmonia axyridis]